MNSEKVEKWIDEVKSGETDSFQDIVDYYQKPLYRYVSYLVNSSIDVEDILQEVFYKIFKNINKYKSSTSFERWIYTITYNHTINTLKKINRKRILLFASVPDSLIESHEKKSTSYKTMKILEKLSLDEKNLIFMRVYQELSYKEISKIIKKSEESLRKKYERVRKKFIKYYREEDEHERSKSKTLNNTTG